MIFEFPSKHCSWCIVNKLLHMETMFMSE